MHLVQRVRALKEWGFIKGFFGYALQIFSLMLLSFVVDALSTGPHTTRAHTISLVGLASSHDLVEIAVSMILIRNPVFVEICVGVETECSEHCMSGV